MARPFRQLRISLAAKCQLLFGAAVALIIAAALFGPWQRMEQLMGRLDERSAATLTSHALLAHVQAHAQQYATSRSAVEAVAPPAATPTSATQPTTMRAVIVDTEPVIAPRIVGVGPRLTTFERRALAKIADEPDAGPQTLYYNRRDGVRAYRYLRPLYARADCLACHADQAEVRATVIPPGDAQDRAPRLLPPGLIGAAVVDIASQREDNQVLLNRVFFIAAGFTAGALAIVVFSLITSRFILLPVRVLQTTAERVGQGDLNIRSDISSGDEFQQLSETFNAMLTNLKRGEDQLRSINANLDLQLGQLAESNVALFESNRLKSEFLANVSHELRTPLTSILGFAELLRDIAPVAADVKGARYVVNIQSAGQNLMLLINDLLDLAKIEAGRMEVRSAELTLGGLFEALTSVLKSLTEPRQIAINATVGAGVPILRTDAAKLQQVLYNLLSNAIKFSPKGGVIRMSAEMVGETRVRIEVADEGPGIDEDKQGMIFEKFRQLDGSVTRQHGGTGLGLAISKELVSLLGGDIGLRSNPGEGAAFWIEIPVEIVARSADLRGRINLM